MRDDQKRALLADGGKGEAVYQYRVRELSGWRDCDAGAYERITTNMSENVEARTLFTAPQAECAPLPKQNVMNIPLNAAAAMADYAPQAECAPREAQPVLEAMQAYLRQCRVGGMPKDVSDQIERAVNQANHLGYFAAPTPERADAEKDAALTNEKIEAAIEAWFDTDGKDVDDHQSRMRAAILAANKEPQP